MTALLRAKLPALFALFAATLVFMSLSVATAASYTEEKPLSGSDLTRAVKGTNWEVTLPTGSGSATREIYWQFDSIGNLTVIVLDSKTSGNTTDLNMRRVKTTWRVRGSTLHLGNYDGKQAGAFTVETVWPFSMDLRGTGKEGRVTLAKVNKVPGAD